MAPPTCTKHTERARRRGGAGHGPRLSWLRLRGLAGRGGAVGVVVVVEGGGTVGVAVTVTTGVKDGVGLLGL